MTTSVVGPMEAGDGAGSRATARAAAGTRPPPWAHSSFAAGGALLVVLGAVVLGGEFGIGSSFNRVPLAIILGAVLVVGLVAPMLLARFAAGRSVTAAAVAAIAVTLPIELGVVIFGGGDVSTNAVRLFLIFTLVAYILLALVPTFRARPIFIFGAAYLLWQWVMFEVLVSSSNGFGGIGGLTPFATGSLVGNAGQTVISSGGGSIGPTGSEGGSTTMTTSFMGSNPTTKLAVASLVIGVVYFLLIRALDRRGRTRVATAFVLPAIIALVEGAEAVGVAAKHVWVIGLALACIGLLVMGIGSGTRRFSTWFGVGSFVIGVALMLGDATNSIADSGNRLGSSGAAKLFAGLAIVVGLAMIVLAPWFGRRLKEDGFLVPAGTAPVAPSGADGAPTSAETTSAETTSIPLEAPVSDTLTDAPSPAPADAVSPLPPPLPPSVSTPALPDGSTLPPAPPPTQSPSSPADGSPPADHAPPPDHAPSAE
jgi:hypothetical protein